MTSRGAQEENEQVIANLIGPIKEVICKASDEIDSFKV